jgi:membrane fusion protein (multidrug efflux system)/multidrug efflux system membrane fusion protein
LTTNPVRTAILGGFALLVLHACGAGGTRTAGSARPALPVRTAPVALQDVVYQIKALGSLEAQELVQVTAEVEGAVSQVRFREGDRVTPQTVLLSIDPERYRLESAGAEATWQKTLADQHRADADWKRREDLARDKLVAPEELNRARQEAERLVAESAAAHAAWEWARQNQRRSQVRPPAAGVINTRTVDTGQYVKMGNVLATLVDTSRLRLRLKVSEAESLRARVGAEVTFRIAALGPRDFKARIYHVGDVADPATRQVEVLAWVRNPGELKPGFFAEVILAGAEKKSATVVPESAVIASEQGFVAYVVEGGTARMRPVEVGLRTGSGAVEILSGVKAGETVVSEGSDRLSDGMPVQDAGPLRGGAAAAPAAAPAK